MMGAQAAATANEEWVYKIEVPANRYDLLCMEGMCQALNVFIGREPIPNFHYVKLGKGKEQRMIVKAETGAIRPFVVSAILRNLTLDARAYDSCLELQKKLHQGVCRERSLVAIGTHDLDTIKGPFTYEALPPSQIKFAPLRHPDKEMNADELFDFIRTGDSYKDLEPYLHLIDKSPVFPVIYDANRVVLSLPPIINGDYSKISKTTKNMLIECTATDLTKANIVLDTMIAAFSEYSSDKFSVERVAVEYPDDRAGAKVVQTPNLDTFAMKASVKDINQKIGNLPEFLDAKKMQKLLNRMMLKTDVVNSDTIQVHVPITRSDVLHPCDIVEDVAISFGFNNIPARVPLIPSPSRQLPINKLTDMVRRELAQAGYMEILTMGLISHQEVAEKMLLESEPRAVVIANPATRDFEVCRTSLLQGMLKTLAANVDTKKPLRLFECSDVVFLDSSTDTGARNERHAVVVYQDPSTAGFQFVHGVLDRLMVALNVSEGEYSMEPSNEPFLFPGKQAHVIVRGQPVGVIGLFHPKVLENFIGNKSLCCPATALEINLEAFL
eukprot:c33367_g1_i1.p1 GENE.c33367_g1_i1~~c33367_g1_i1.p1  ORF type:complete len:614 (-),score=180.37 c33367_g1_i1:113-1774(-)